MRPEDAAYMSNVLACAYSLRKLREIHPCEATALAISMAQGEGIPDKLWDTWKHHGLYTEDETWAREFAIEHWDHINHVSKL